MPYANCVAYSAYRERRYTTTTTRNTQLCLFYNETQAYCDRFPDITFIAAHLTDASF